MHLKEIEYGSLLTYCPRGDSPELIGSRNMMAALKQDLRRIRAVPKSEYSLPGKRPKPAEHFNSLEVQRSLDPVEEIVLIDDVITLGSTILGAANCFLMKAFPDSKIRAFAAMRSIRNPKDFEKSFSPVRGTISFREKKEADTI